MPKVRAVQLSILAGATVLLASPDDVTADEGMPVSFYELVQQGESVEITFDYDSIFADPSGTYALLLERTDEDGTHVLLDYESLNAGDVVDTSPGSCLYGEDEEYCQENECYDCDGDSVDECPGDCVYTHYYLYTDGCVPAGWVTYHVEGQGSYWPDSAQIEVEDVGQDCPDPAGEGADGGDSGCSVSSVGEQLPFGGLVLFMLAIGLVAGRLGRNGKSS